jgi:hypothetical protein
VGRVGWLWVAINPRPLPSSCSDSEGMWVVWVVFFLLPVFTLHSHRNTRNDPHDPHNPHQVTARDFQPTPQPTPNPHPRSAAPPQADPMTDQPPAYHAIAVKACTCCATARWYCGNCGLPGAWLVPSPAPSWPVYLDKGSCPRCRASLSVQILGYGPERPEVTALERVLRLPPARRHRRGFGAA